MGSGYMAMKSTPSPDWESLLKRLTAVAFGWFYDRRCSDDESVLPGTGVSARDLVYNAYLELLKNEGEYKPKSDEDSFRVIYTVMRRDFIDLVRKGRSHDRTVILDASVDAECRNEFENLPDNMQEFARKLDENLRKKNVYYDDLISGSILKPLRIRTVRKNGFIDYMKSVGKLGGQNKVPRLSNDRKIADDLVKWADN